ncbi:MAG: restriction endonuclease subunit S [Clostridium sp.]|nr:restriction endonuclease subunit S [Clostridium sp.]
MTKKDWISGTIPYIGSSFRNNGIIGFIKNENDSKCHNILGINCDGSVGECFYHPYLCLFSDHVNKLQLKHKEGNKYIYLFLKTCILKQKNKYSFGYPFYTYRMEKQKIKIPITETNQPNYSFMENYMKEIEKKVILKK